MKARSTCYWLSLVEGLQPHAPILGRQADGLAERGQGLAKYHLPSVLRIIDRKLTHLGRGGDTDRDRTTTCCQKKKKKAVQEYTNYSVEEG